MMAEGGTISRRKREAEGSVMKSNLFTSTLKTVGPREAFEFRCCGSQVNQEVNL